MYGVVPGFANFLFIFWGQIYGVLPLIFTFGICRYLAFGIFDIWHIRYLAFGIFEI
jgi:hypothetical protein